MAGMGDCDIFQAARHSCGGSVRGGGISRGDIPSRRLLRGVSQAQLGAGDLQDRAHRVHACGHGRGDSYRGGE